MRTPLNPMASKPSNRFLICVVDEMRFWICACLTSPRTFFIPFLYRWRLCACATCWSNNNSELTHSNVKFIPALLLLDVGLLVFFFGTTMSRRCCCWKGRDERDSHSNNNIFIGLWARGRLARCQRASGIVVTSISSAGVRRHLKRKLCSYCSERTRPSPDGVRTTCEVAYLRTLHLMSHLSSDLVQLIVMTIARC